jgi:hydroxyacylglutathione hydrolase
VTGAQVVASGKPGLFRPPRAGENAIADASGGEALAPDIALGDKQSIRVGDWEIEGIATPGHTADHMAFALPGRGIVFSGDHVMGWSTSIVSPPEGSMAAYLASLRHLLDRPESRYLPGHGGPVAEAADHVRSLLAHRAAREAAIIGELDRGERTIAEIVRAVYRDVDPGLHAAAAMTVFAHLEDLVLRGRAATDGAPMIGGRYRAVR